ncbi:SWIM zinc finger family protein [Aspergillus piperis CBS 112811]|uniref:SWIM zinc finger family protein n=1 Tax=Aspergillus piperis CBS 112811 TaxID=1448313 RepID=A0A8G1VRZ5_9EURO|nr:SWIM zinc finger family protein [Aspergillus piperis CBS 112811]RAH62362.1 SWIM zinc finger family protein [Aspergillus piperis CBS 112811]
MSAPTRQFHDLSITGNMPTTRSHPEKEPHTDDSDSSELLRSESDESHAEGDSAASSSVRGKSGITYDLARLDSDTEARALVGLTSQFKVVSCCTTRTGFDFQFIEQPRVHLGSEGYTCTCSTFSGMPNVACQHIFWLLDQLHGCFVPQPPPSDILLSSDGRLPNFGRVEQLLDGKLETIADQLCWQYVRSEAEGGMSRQDIVRDILSAFSPVILPKEFRLDLVDDAGQSRTPEQCVVQGDFEATMFRLAVHDDGVYSSLCKAMPIAACAVIFFDKVHQRLRKLLADFDRYCLTGQASNEARDLDVEAVISKIQENVDRVWENIIARAPHGMEGAAKTLVTLLEDICGRNKDALEGNERGRVTFHGEDEDQRNLFHQLIGKADETGEFFILDALEHVPAMALHQFVGRLKAILHRIEVDRAPKAYILRLDALIRAAESPLANAGQKRPSSSTSRGYSKRTR